MQKGRDEEFAIINLWPIAVGRAPFIALIPSQRVLLEASKGYCFGGTKLIRKLRESRLEYKGLLDIWKINPLIKDIKLYDILACSHQARLHSTLNLDALKLLETSLKVHRVGT